MYMYIEWQVQLWQVSQRTEYHIFIFRALAWMTDLWWPWDAMSPPVNRLQPPPSPHPTPSSPHNAHMLCGMIPFSTIVQLYASVHPIGQDISQLVNIPGFVTRRCFLLFCHLFVNKCVDFSHHCSV